MYSYINDVIYLLSVHVQIYQIKFKLDPGLSVYLDSNSNIYHQGLIWIQQDPDQTEPPTNTLDTAHSSSFRMTTLSKLLRKKN